jgi:uncharacterized phage-associated protein
MAAGLANHVSTLEEVVGGADRARALPRPQYVVDSWCCKHKLLRTSNDSYMLCSMAYTAKAVANYLLDLAASQGTTLDPLKIQKLVYFSHGWHLALRDQPLLRDSVEAWAHGPVIPDLYHEFKRWGSGPIQRAAVAFHGARPVTPSLDAECVWDTNADDAKTIIRRVWDVYGKWDGLQLSTLTHQAGTPWAQTRAKNPGKQNIDIPDELIKAFFKSQATRNVRHDIANG